MEEKQRIAEQKFHTEKKRKAIAQGLHSDRKCRMEESKFHTERKPKITAQEIAMAGLMVAVIEVSKAALSFLPNIELTTFWLIMFTLFFGRKIAMVVPVFILIEGTVYGFGLWWLMYLYAWPVLVFLVWKCRKQESAWFWATLSGAFGLSFGALCAIPYFFIGAAGGKLAAGFQMAFAWWVAGIPWDIVHCGGNFVLMLLLYRPVSCVIKKLAPR